MSDPLRALWGLARKQIANNGEKRMTSWHYYFLTVYFVLIMGFSIYLLILIWNPGQPTQSFRTSYSHIVYGPGVHNHITMKNGSQNLTAGTKNDTSIIWSLNDNSSITRTENRALLPLFSPRNEVLSFIPVSPPRNDLLSLQSNRDTRLLIESALFGILGASVQGISSLTTWRGSNKLEKGWEGFYISRPLLGAALAIITYLVLRAGFIGNGPSVNTDFAIAAISALVGISTVQVTKKLRDVFNEVFGIKKDPEQKGDQITQQLESEHKKSPDES
jgi:hypothetical protein